MAASNQTNSVGYNSQQFIGGAKYADTTDGYASQIDGLTGQIRSLNGDLIALAAETAKMADAMFGPIPQPVSANSIAPTPQPSGRVWELAAAVDAYRSHMNDLREQLSRLKSL